MNLNWYALSVYRNKVFEVSQQITDDCDDIYIPTAKFQAPHSADSHLIDRPAIPRLMFIRTDEHTALDLEKQATTDPRRVPFYIYRNIAKTVIQPIADEEMRMFILVSSMGDRDLEYLPAAPDTYRQGDHVRVTAGPFKGAEGYIKRIKKNRRVVVEIFGVCAVALPYIHRELLVKID